MEKEKQIIRRKLEEKKEHSRLIAVIRISGMVKVKSDIVSTLARLRLRRKYSCVLINANKKDLLGMLEKVKYYTAYGEISEEVLVKLLKERGQKIDKGKFDAEEIVKKLVKGRTLNELGFKPFFRLHPPRGGIKSKLQYPKGVLEDNGKDINKLIERML